MGVREYRKVRRVYFDMDGVIADFNKACEIAGIPPKEYKNLKGSYINIPVYEGAIHIINRALELGYDIFALTKPPTNNFHSYSEKAEWIHKNIPQFKDHIIITPDKGVVGKPIDILIDDHPEWANALEFPGTIIKFEGDWAVVEEKLLELAPMFDV